MSEKKRFGHVIYSQKKGFGDAASTLILFIAVVAVSVGLVIAIQNYTLKTQDSMSFQNELTNNQIRTSIDIINVFYNSSNENLYIYVKNLGQTNLDGDGFSLFVNKFYVPQYDSYKAEDLLTPLGILQPSQVGVLVANLSLDSGTHVVRLVSQYGGTGATDYFNN